MTIRTSIDARALSDQLGNLEECARMAPEGTYEDAKALADFFDDLFRHMRAELIARNIYGVSLPNNDSYREVEAVLYGAIKDASPDSTVFPVAEGFGAAMFGPAADRVISQAVRDRDFLRTAGVI